MSFNFKNITQFFLYILLVVISSYLFHALVFNNPEDPNRTLFSIIAGFTLSSLISSLHSGENIFYQAFGKRSKGQKPVQKELPPVYNGVKHSGTLSKQNGLPVGFTVAYQNAWQQPILGSTNSEGLDLPKGASFVFITIKFGNGKVVINPKTRQVAILGIKDLKVLVKDGEKIKVLID